MLSSSFKTLDRIFTFPPTIIDSSFTLENYTELFTKYTFSRTFLNSLFISSAYTMGAVFFCTLAGYGFAKFDFKGKAVLFIIVLGSMMIPFEATMVPLYIIFQKLGWINKYIGLIIPGLANAFGIFFMKQYLEGISNEIIESGRIDGCKEFSIFIRLILPISLPALASLGIIFFMGSWNGFLWPLTVLKSPAKYKLAVALRNFEQGIRTPYHLIMAGSVVSIAPLIVVFVMFQRQFITGITSGAIKG
jgi:ABC-type glycerol-3-phosphate transport system permease component